MTGQPPDLAFYATPPHECSYLPQHEATTVFADPNHPKDMRLYSRLSENGFRRSGEHIYVPACEKCRACVPVRVPVATFSPRRSQRRINLRNADLRVTVAPDQFNEAQFQLYRRYVKARHRGGGMDDPSREEYMSFLTSEWSDTVFYEFRLQAELLAVAVTDRLENGLSCVYTFFEPAARTRSLGVYAILWQIQEAARLGFEFCYLGYWIEETPKMQYKADYLPQEHFLKGRWRLASRQLGARQLESGASNGSADLRASAE